MKSLVLFQRSIELDKMYRNFFILLFYSFLFFIRAITEKNKFLYFKLNKQSLKSMGISSHPEMWKELFFGESYQSLCFWGWRPEKSIPWKIRTFFLGWNIRSFSEWDLVCLSGSEGILRVVVAGQIRLHSKI